MEMESKLPPAPLTLTEIQAALPAGITVQKVLAQGGQGVVFTGSAFGRPAAVKLYKLGQNQVRIDREVQALKAFSAPTTVRLLWAGQVSLRGNAHPAVATEFVDGTPLDHLLRGRALTHAEVENLVVDVATSIREFWSARMVHRDLKPPNLIWRPSGRACVIDLGVARHIDQTTLTAAGTTWGTRGYMSPEQAHAAKQLTCKSDVYALGVIAVQALTQVHPSAGDQGVLLSMDLPNHLPVAAATWRHSDLLRRMLSSKAFRRPTPEQIINQI